MIVTLSIQPHDDHVHASTTTISGIRGGSSSIGSSGIRGDSSSSSIGGSNSQTKFSKRGNTSNIIKQNTTLKSKINENDPKYTPRHIHLALTGSDDEMSLIFFTNAKFKNYQVIYSTSYSELQNYKQEKSNLIKKNSKELIKIQSTHHNYFSYQVNGMYSELTVHEFILNGLSQMSQEKNQRMDDSLKNKQKTTTTITTPTTTIYYRILFNHDPSSTHSTPIESFNILNRKDAVERSIQSAQQISNASPSTISSTISSTSSSSSTLIPSIEPSFQFLVYGDMDIYGDGQKTIQSILQHHRDSTRFIIHVGDIPYVWNSEHEYKWERWFDMIEPITKKIPYVVCNGNHENASNFTSYKSRFTNSTRSLQSSATTFSNLYYSFDYGPIHFIAISSEHDFKLQTLWMERDLSKVDRNKTPFVIFYTHRPMYSSNENHGSYEPLRTQVEFILRKYNIDLALYGHVHAYERTCLMRENFQCVHHSDGNNTNQQQQQHHKYYFNQEQMSKGTIHIHVGTAGFELNPKWDSPQPDWSEYRETNHGYLRIKVYGDSLMQVEFLRDGVESVDSFLIDKSNK
ncbi:hypothetical protein FDP41_004819 [Naegleria fowleri]|uniref:Acid phosphatase n=1 Tax=Naegleria fowleri TaxID=5763 RepID=A0A6A5BPV2_NAEFO|nr:uncharacterized protein FDP41_004819 [Naegleria fowleri]KAF0976144.1 hypothetical protein FDP41_004819 [Naegleria fowleri]